MSRHLKRFSYKQMWNFANKSRSFKKQEYWMKRIYTKKIKEAEKMQEYTRVEYLKTLKSGIKKRIKIQSRFGPIARIQDWTIASEKDLKDLVFYGKEAKNNILIADKDNKLIAYEGTTLYNEVMEAKQNMSKFLGVKDVTEALKKWKVKD